MPEDRLTSSRKAATFGDQEVIRGEGGETHQTAGGDAPVLTTQQGIPVADDQNSLRVGDRGPTLLEDFHFREKIFHFDHERIPERVVHARGFGAHGYFENYESLADVTRADLFQRAGREDARLRPLLDRRRQQGLGRPGPRRPRLRREVLHQGGQLGPRRQQHPGLLHPGRDQVPRPDPRRQAGAGPRLPAGADGPRQLLGLHLAHAREHAHDHVGHVRPGDPALVPLHGGLRRPHLPPGQRRGQVDLRQVPLEAEAGPAVGRLERGGEDQRRRPRLPPPRPLERHRGRRLSRSGSSASSSSTRPSPRSSTSTSSTPPRSSPRSWCRSGSIGRHGARPHASTTSSPRPSRSPSAPRTSCPASTSPTTRCCRGATSPTSTPS